MLPAFLFSNGWASEYRIRAFRDGLSENCPAKKKEAGRSKSSPSDQVCSVRVRARNNAGLTSGGFFTYCLAGIY
jgi:hypothetical protein